MAKRSRKPPQVKNHYLGNDLIKKDGVQHQYTPEEISEYHRCMVDIGYFAEKYVKVIHLDRGLVPYEPYEYQRRMFEHLTDNRFSAILACRQSGKSITCVIWLLHYAIFNPEKSLLILANKGDTAREMLSRITLALENLPFFLQPGCRAVNKSSLEFSNRSKIYARATSSSSVRGLSCSVILLDEFAFVQNAEAFYTSTYPVISSGKTTKVIVVSTMNGPGNPFYRIWQGAVQGINEYRPFRVDWWDVPGRDEEWKRQTIANTSQLQFDQEFGNQAIGSTDTLISAQCLLGLKVHPPIHNHESVRVYAHPEPDHRYIMTVDVAKGRGQDYSTFIVVDTTVRPFQIAAIYRNNMISPLLFPDIIYKYGHHYNDAYVIVESNDVGALVATALYYELEYENMFVESMVSSKAIGLNMTKKIKRIGCSNLKDIVEQSKIDIVDADIIEELCTFEGKGNSYEAADGCHDDLVMTLVSFAWFLSTDLFNEITSIDFKDMIYREKIKMINDDLPFAGFLGDDDDHVKYEVSDGLVWQETPRDSYL